MNKCGVQIKGAVVFYFAYRAAMIVNHNEKIKQVLSYMCLGVMRDHLLSWKTTLNLSAERQHKVFWCKFQKNSFVFYVCDYECSPVL